MSALAAAPLKLEGVGEPLANLPSVSAPWVAKWRELLPVLAQQLPDLLIGKVWPLLLEVLVQVQIQQQVRLRRFGQLVLVLRLHGILLRLERRSVASANPHLPARRRRP